MMQPTRALAITTLFGMLCSPWLAPAQTVSGEDLTSLSIEDLVRVKVFSASRHLEEARGAPAAVSVVTAEEIATFGWRTLGDVLNSVRGFYTANDRNYTYLGVRGLLRSGDFNSRILLLLNGHRLNDNTYDSAFIGTEFPLDLDLVERIEIVRGSSSSLYGTNAVFAVVNVITRKPRGPIAVEVAATSASLLSRTGRMTLSGERGRAAALVSASLYRSAGQEVLYYPEFSATNGGRALDLDGDRFGQLFADMRYGNIRLQALLASRTKIIPTASFDTTFNDPGTRTRDTRAYFDFAYHGELARTELTLRTYYDRYRFHGVYVYSQSDGSGRSLNLDDSLADWTGVDFNLGRALGRHRISMGAEYEYSFRVNQDNHDAGGAFHVHDSRTPWRTAAYGEVELKLLSALTVKAGGRFDYFGQFGATASPRLAVIYLPNSRTAVKYIFGRAFRAPNSYQAYYSDGITLEANPNLRPETVLSHNVLLERTFTSWLHLSAGAFYNAISNLIDPALDPSTGMTRFINVGRMTARGLEFEAHAGQLSGFNLRASYTPTDARDPLTGRRVNNAPVHLAKLHGRAPLAHKAVVGLELLYTSPQKSHKDSRISPSFLTNLTVSTRPWREHWEFSASCYNLFDRRWYSPAGPEHAQSGIEQDGRVFRFKVVYRFSTVPEPKPR
jgi:outer membrane receptor for ferrienterochelin and colicins